MPDAILYQFSRPLVECGDFTAFITRFKDPPRGRRLRDQMGSFVFFVEGYDTDPRELYAITEVRSG